MTERPEAGGTGNHASNQRIAPAQMDEALLRQSALARFKEFLAYRPETMGVFVAIVLFRLLGYVIGEDFVSPISRKSTQVRGSTR